MGKSNFTIGSLLALMLVASFSAASLAFLWQSATKDLSSIGWFIPFTAIAPMGLMVLIYWGLVLLKTIKGAR